MKSEATSNVPAEQQIAPVDASTARTGSVLAEALLKKSKTMLVEEMVVAPSRSAKKKTASRARDRHWRARKGDSLSARPSDADRAAMQRRQKISPIASAPKAPNSAVRASVERQGGARSQN